MVARRALVLLAILGVFVASLTAMARLADAESDALPGNIDPYIHRTTGETADPINLVFRGNLETARAAIQSVLGWQPTEGSDMLFVGPSSQHLTDAQFGFDLGNGSRYHIRLRDMGTIDGRPYVLGAVHRDDSVTCGHVGRAFNTMRDMVAGSFAESGYAASRLELQNTEPGRQCDGSFTFGDGSATVIDLARHTGPARFRVWLPLGLSFSLPRLFG